MKRKYKKSKPDAAMFVVVNKDGMVFAGLRGGHYFWSNNWSEAKPLYKENTIMLLQENKGAELIKEKDF